MEITISIIIPIHNGEKWVDKCFKSIWKQDILRVVPVQVCVFDDSSNDNTRFLISKWRRKAEACGLFDMVVSYGEGSRARGVGYAKNRAVERSRGRFLCFQDIDDEMEPCRLSKQLFAARKNCDAIVGCLFKRDPADATARFTRWANSLPESLLDVQVYTSHGPTVIMPTWFCSRGVFDRIGGFAEDGKGTPEDLIFFYRHLDLGGTICRVNECLLLYRYHPAATTFSVSEQTIWDLRMQRLEEKVLKKWPNFTIWNAGKQGRRFWRSLSIESRSKVTCFCDVDVRKVGGAYEPYFSQRKEEPVRIPIRHFRECEPPFLICMKLDLTKGEFEANLASLHLKEGKDFILFS